MASGGASPATMAQQQRADLLDRIGTCALDLGVRDLRGQPVLGMIPGLRARGEHPTGDDHDRRHDYACASRHFGLLRAANVPAVALSARWDGRERYRLWLRSSAPSEGRVCSLPRSDAFGGAAQRSGVQRLPRSGTQPRNTWDGRDPTPPPQASNISKSAATACHAAPGLRHRLIQLNRQPRGDGGLRRRIPV